MEMARSTIFIRPPGAPFAARLLVQIAGACCSMMSVK
jgi:hypothetical protein